MNKAILLCLAALSFNTVYAQQDTATDGPVANTIVAAEASIKTTNTGRIEAGEAKSAPCTACHGPDGNSVNPAWPKTAGQHASYIVKQLQNYKLGAEGGRMTSGAALMYGQSAVLSEQDMLDLGAYYASKEISVGTADDELAARGELIYRGGVVDADVPACIGCHGPAGKGNPGAGYPTVGGQHAQYAYEQLMAFKNGQRMNDENAMMRNVVRKMSDADMRAVSEYMQGLYRRVVE